jgi:Family of unknown function (DUF6111)
MIRPVLIEVTLFLIPFAAYAVFIWATRSGIFDSDAWNVRVVGWLALAAAVLIIGSFILMARFGAAPPYSTYEPAHMEDGQLVPGRNR